MIHRRKLFRRNDRVKESGVRRGEYGYAACRRQKPGRPRDCFEHIVLKGGVAPITDPAGNRQQKLDPASSAMTPRVRLRSQLASQRSATFVTACPPEQLDEKMPSFNLLALNIKFSGLRIDRPVIWRRGEVGSV
jgi:hypothetical protein